MADEQPHARDEIDDWADELIEQIEESLARHAEFERLFPEADRDDEYAHLGSRRKEQS